MINKEYRNLSRKGLKKRIAALAMAGVMMLTACGKSGGSGEGGASQGTAIGQGVTTTLPGTGENPGQGDEPGAGQGGNISTEVKKEGNGIGAPQGVTTNLSASITRGEVTNSTESEEEAFINATANLSLAFMKYLTQNGDGSNVMISPESVITALAMTENGAKGETLNEMLEVLGGGMTLDQYQKAVAGFNGKLTSTEPACLSMANSIWMRNSEEMKISESFLQTNVDYHNSEFFLADFDNNTLNDVNSWVNEKTNGMIPKTLDQLSPDTMMLLINAAAFEAKWMDEYEETQVHEGRTFTNAKGEEETVTMLNSTEYGLIELNGGQGFVKKYEGGQYAYVAILPGEGVSADEYIAGLKGEDFIKAYQNRSFEKNIIVNMPEFKSDYDISLIDAFNSLGMTTALSDAAQFGGMLESGEDILKIGDIIHKTHIEVDRNGTKAAAVTVVEMEKCSAEMEPASPVFITLDRPFVYAIVETDTGLPVFLGTVNTVK